MRRFETDEEFLAHLASVNPDCDYYPRQWDFAEAMRKARLLHQRLQAELGPDVQLDGAVQDASYHAGVYIPPHGEVRLSNFDHLAAITGEERIPEPILLQIVRFIEESGYTFVPFRLLGEPFDRRERINGDLFNRLFDYL